MIRLSIFYLFSATLFALPVIRPGGVVNAASFSARGGLAQGALATVFGTGLGPALPGVSATSFPLATSLAGVAVRLTQGAATVNALPVFASAGQVNFILPSNTPTGEVEARVVYNGETSLPIIVTVVRSNFAFFTFNQEARTRAVVQNVITGTDTPVNLPGAAARPGQTLVAYGTGLGPITALDNAAAPPGDIPGTNIEVLVGGVAARRTYAGRSPCCAGLDQLVFEVPSNAPLGCTVPIVVRSGEAYSNVGEISIAASGGACVEPFLAATGGQYCVEGRLGSLFLGQGLTEFSFAGVPPFIGGLFSQGFFIETERVCGAIPPSGLGTCTVRSTQGGGSAPLPNIAPPPTSPRYRFLDAGATLSIRGPLGSETIPASFRGFYQLLGGNFLDKLFLVDGSYRITNSGGEDVGAFTADFDLKPVRATGPARGSNISRARAPTINWTGSPETMRDYITISVVLPDVQIQCVVDPQRSSFTIPPWTWNQATAASGPGFVAYVSVGGFSVYNPLVLRVPGLSEGLRLMLSSSHGYDLNFTR